MAAFALLPFAGVRLPSMTDLPGHIGRYAVMLDGGRSPWLAQYYAFDWRLVGNLGVDLLVTALAPLGAERAGWAAAAAIAPLTILGMAAVSRALHGRVQPGAVLAACFAFANPLLFGFVNYSLSFALALFAFAAWVRWREAAVWRAVPCLALATLGVWLAHAMGWGVLVLLVAGFEAERLARRRSAAALGDAVLRGLALLPPVLLTLLWRGDGGALAVWGDDLAVRKIMNWVVVLRGEAKWLDLATPVLIAAALFAARRRQVLDPRLAAGALLVALACAVMPTTLFGSWGADERIAPAAIVAALLSLRWYGCRAGARKMVLLAVALFGMRTTLIAIDWHRLDRAYAMQLSALDHVPQGARVHAVVLQDGCRTAWQATAWNHLPSLAVARRDALVNSQWLLPGAALLTVRYPLDPALVHDPSQSVDGFDCDGALPDPLATRRRALEGGAWQYLWVIGTRGTDPWPGMRPVWRNADGALYRLPSGG